MKPKPKLSDIVNYFKKNDKNVSDTLIVSDKNSPRLKAYQDSSILYNEARKYYDIKSNLGGPKDRSLKSFKSSPFNKNYTQKDALGEIKGSTYTIPKGAQGWSPEDISNQNRFNKISKKTFSSKIYPIGYYPMEGFAPTYKKPVQPVKYKKTEPVKETKKEQPKPVQAKQNVYQGSPVYSSGTGSGAPSALIGFMSKSGDTTYIKPEDYQRFGVPKYAKDLIESKTKKK